MLLVHQSVAGIMSVLLHTTATDAAAADAERRDTMTTLLPLTRLADVDVL